MAAVGQAEAVQFRKPVEVGVAVVRAGLGGLLVPYVADPLEEEQRQDPALPVRPVDGAAAQDLRAVPEVGLQVLERQATRGHRRRAIRASFACFVTPPLACSPPGRRGRRPWIPPVGADHTRRLGGGAGVRAGGRGETGRVPRSIERRQIVGLRIRRRGGGVTARGGMYNAAE